MELIVLVALVVGALVLRKLNQRVKTLEHEVALLRSGSVDVQPVETDASLPAEIPATALSEQPLDDDDDAVSGPWGEVTAFSDDDEAVAEPEPVAARAAPKKDFETALGTRWAVWVGGLALALGGVFLVRYSIEAGIFGPQVRLAGAAIFGLLLAAAGEFVRRRGSRTSISGINDAYVPAILTAAATFTLFSTVYAAHGLYGFIGPATAFGLLAVIALGTMALALLHGQALAGLGLLGSYLTPLLVSSTSPAAWTLFIYLTIVLVSSVAVASLRQWRFLSVAAYLGAGVWSVLYLSTTWMLAPMPLTMLQLAGLAMLGLVWLARPRDDAGGVDLAAAVASVFVLIVSVFLARGSDGLFTPTGLNASVILVAAMAVAAWRARATMLLHAAGLATLCIAGWVVTGGGIGIDLFYGQLLFDGVWFQPGPDLFLRYSLALAVIFVGAGIAMARLAVGIAPRRSAEWAFWAAVVPLWVVVTTWVSTGELNVDWGFAAAALALAGILALGAELVGQAETPQQVGGRAITFLTLGAALAACVGLLAGFGPVLTTVLTGLAAAVPAAATRTRSWPVLGWASAVFAVMTLGRIGFDPTIAGAEFLSTTPVVNALTPGYFLPALAFGFAAWQLARTTDGKPRLMMEAFAALFTLVGAAMLVRHAMNGGIIQPGEPTLAEQAIYTLIMIGGGAIMLALDKRAPSPVFQWGSIALGVVSVATIALSHLISLNPLLTNESTGTIPVFNLLLLAYLLPALALAALAWRARGLRPDWYVTMLAAAAAALGFAYISLSVRRLFHGEFIGSWKGMSGLETYTYSAVWLALGVVVLAAGLRFKSRVLRLGSAVLVVAAVAKVFLYDMRELEGVLRALSFMGLGAVLIGIGMFYQRMLMSARKDEAEEDQPIPQG